MAGLPVGGAGMSRRCRAMADDGRAAAPGVVDGAVGVAGAHRVRVVTADRAVVSG